MTPAAAYEADNTDSFDAALARLNKLSVERHTHAYDIDWDDPAFSIRPEGPPVELPTFDPLGRTEWYRSLPAEERRRLALYRYAACMKIGWHFENLLQQGLLRYATRLPNGTPEFRYLHHEIVEESEHTLMFQEFVNRTGLPVRGMPRALRWLAQFRVVPLAQRFPALFFLFVLGGEDPVDQLQRRQLKEEGGRMHPLVERIMRIHVAEEARHLSFARHYLNDRTPQLGRGGRAVLSVLAPIVLAVMARLMFRPPGDLVRRFGIPRDVLREAYGSAEGRRSLADSVAKTRRLWVDLGLVGPFSRQLWKAGSIWEPGVRGVRAGAAR
ncbi:MAG: diiron oxygenase [Actinomycetota bacterium]|nr:diiron oxygenase [Actinomycetota bacterium]